MSAWDIEHGRERIATRRRELSEGRAPYTGPRWIWTGILLILLVGVIVLVNGKDADAAVLERFEVTSVVADPGDQAWFLCVAHRPYGVGYVYNEFMVSSTIAQCFVDYTPSPGPSCPNLYRYQVWWTPAYGGWTGPHSIGRVC